MTQESMWCFLEMRHHQRGHSGTLSTSPRGSITSELVSMFTHTSLTSYYIPGEAVLYGTMNNNKSEDDGEGILIYGHGTLSGDRLPHPHYANVSETERWRYHGINIDGKYIFY